ncbi:MULTISPECIES: TetR/AcrR family transcriptional regulator [Aquincola]|uniref:TetR/AcrR family transcriptional regulator n=1 Tax=Aquincola TaxID=391952 RepID=UPI0006153B06|nr:MULTISPECIES: TetR/AcrR family transcriptional regulator [Aquincola]MCR5863915.1 TetR/AcrR family transcriptional regulator [Aquincola sp. J276]
MARTRAATYDDQREHILAQAAALFAHQGYPGTSMNQVAAACGVSKATLYHYMRDKAELLAQIAQSHVGRLEALVAEVGAMPLPAEQRLRLLISRFVREYADAQHHHRVLTEDVKFLDPQAHQQVLDGQRRVVNAFARTLVEVRPALAAQQLDKPLTMLLFGMINWMFTWLKPDGALNHEAMAPLVADLFFGGLHAVNTPQPAPRVPRSPIHPKETAR